MLPTLPLNPALPGPIVPVQAPRSLVQPAPPTRGASTSLALPLATLSLAAASRSPKKQRRTLNALTGDAESPHIVSKRSLAEEDSNCRQWRYARRSRLLNSLDWTRYHLWVYFVDSCEPSYARSRLCRFFFEKVCQGHSTASLLYCAAGGLETTQKEEMDLELPASVPDLHSDDLQNLVVPPYTFTPMDFSMYDVVVAADEAFACEVPISLDSAATANLSRFVEATAEAVRKRLRETGQSDRDELCVLSDFMDAYDENPVLEPAPGIAQGILSQDGLAHLMPGQPLRGTPPPRPVGPPLPGLPSAWQELWSVANRCLAGNWYFPASDVGRILHAIVGLERCLRASIPQNMRWWNDEDLRLGNAPERSEGGYKARAWADHWDFQRQVPVRRVGKLRPAVPGVPLPAFQDKVAEFFSASRAQEMGNLPGLSEELETSYRNLWQRGWRLKAESQELLGLERLGSVRSGLREETLQAFRRHRYKSLLGLQLLRGFRRRRALDASWLLRSDVLLERQSSLGPGTPEALHLVKLSSDASVTVRPHRSARLRQRSKHGTSRISRSRRCPSAAWKGRLQVRRAEKEEGGGDCAEIIQAKAAWVSHCLLVDRSRFPESEVPRPRRAEEIQPLLPGQIIWTEEVVSAGRHMGEGGGSSMYLPPMKILLDRAEHAERVALASVLNRLGDAKKIRGVIRLYTSAALCISCLAAFCHCKRLFTSLFFEISCDSADESQRWSDTATGGEETLGRTSQSYSLRFVSPTIGAMTSLVVLESACGGGCVSAALAFAWQAWKTRRSNRMADHSPPPLASPATKYMTSPTKHIHRESQPSYSPTSKVSAEASLTTNEADLSKLPGIGQGLDKNEFLDLLRKLLAESKHLQNNPPNVVIKELEAAWEVSPAKVVRWQLQAVSTRAGGPLIVEELEYVPGRSNLKVTYPGSGKETTSFVGSHFDVDPFQLTVEGDLLYGRGTTDCLGHVALLTLFLRELGRTKPALKRSIVVVFIAAEEGGEKNIGVDAVLKNGKLEEAKNGPVYWVDCADSNPCCGTAGALSWSLKCRGRLFHSGFPNKAINSIELASEDWSRPSRSSKSELYSFVTGSHMKPTQIECSKGSFNQIPAETTVHGDIRLSPFYEVEDVVEHIERYELNDDMECLFSSARGPWSKFVLPSGVQVQDGEVNRAKVELKWVGDMDTFRLYAGLAVQLESDGHKALVQAFRESNKGVQPFSINGSLPLVKMMQKAGFDIQMCGFGKMSVYHGVNEYCTFAEMTKAHEVIVRLICLLDWGQSSGCVTSTVVFSSPESEYAREFWPRPDAMEG
eukprot:s4939_g2.t1